MGYLRESASFARPADTTAYAAADLVANDTTAGSVVVPRVSLIRVGTGIRITGGILEKSSVTVANAAFRVHIFSGAVPVPTVGDNAALVAAQVMASSGGNAYRGSLVAAAANWYSLSDRTICPLTPLVSGHEILMGAAPAELIVAFLIEATAAYVPASAETFTFTPFYFPVVDDPSV